MNPDFISFHRGDSRRLGWSKAVRRALRHARRDRTMSDLSHYRRIALLGVPVEIGASQRGTLMGPAALRTAGLGALLQDLGYVVEDRGDLAPQSPPSTDAPPD